MSRDGNTQQVSQSHAGRLEAARLEFDAQVRRFELAQAGLQEIIAQTQKDGSQREFLRHSAFARLQARLDSMPVIEQAKGVLMAQQHCGPDEAFELLRRASQRANMKLRVLAAQIVAQVAAQPGSLSAASPLAAQAFPGDARAASAQMQPEVQPKALFSDALTRPPRQDTNDQ